MTRIIRYIVICLVLGSVSTILAAQICAAWVPVWNSNLISEGVTAQQGRAWRVAIFERTGATYVRAQAIWDVGLYRHGQFANANRVLAPASYEAVQLLHQSPDPALPFESRFAVTWRGWPFLALRRTMPIPGANDLTALRRSNNLVPIGLPDAQLIHTADPIVDDEFTAAPLNPIWSGFALDTALYAVTWAILLSIVVPVWRMLGRRRIILRATVAIVLGALTTIAVAWSCALWSDVGSGRTWTEVYRDREQSGHFVFVQQSIALGATHIQQQDEPLGSFTRTMPWTGLQLPGSSRSGSLAVKIVDARGWPFEALHSQFDASIDRQSGQGTIDRIKFGLSLESTASPAAGPLRTAKILPLRPISVGFAADTVFYSVAWFTLLIIGAVPMWLRVSRRRRRGECEQCGYDLRGNSGGDLSAGCPECGWRREVDA